jgi:hypothetical protein
MRYMDFKWVKMNKRKIIEVSLLIFIIFIVYFFIEITEVLKLRQSDNITLLIQNVGLALVTILIPIFVAAYTEKDKTFVLVDQQLLVGYLLKGIQILLDILLIFIPPFFWQLIDSYHLSYAQRMNNVYLVFRLYLIALPIIGIYGLANKAIRAFSWLKGNKNISRFEFLKELKDTSVLDEIWRNIWINESPNVEVEESFLNIFYDKIDELLRSNKKNFDLILSLLEGFAINLEKRKNANILTMKKNNFLRKILGYYLILHKRCYKDSKIYLATIDDAFQNIIEKVKNFYSKKSQLSIVLRVFRQHVQSIKAEENNEKEEIEEYLNTIFSLFLPQFFDDIVKYSDSSYFWRRLFPKEWKITEKNLEDYKNGKNIIVNIVRYEFEHWAVPRILTIKEGIDVSMNDVVENLFPDVDPEIWAKILIFKYTPKPRGNNTIAVIERPWNFGVYLSIEAFRGSSEENIDDGGKYRKEVQSAIGLAKLLYSTEFSKENIQEYIEELKLLAGKYGDRSTEENKRVSLLRMFEEFKKFYNYKD